MDDARLQYRISQQWRFSVGIDNIGNRTSLAFHGRTQRPYSAELRYQL